jgi:RNA polymerase sigma factor (sigma-70 family)
MSEPETDSDLQLLVRYTRDRAEDAFADLVRRHINLVHSAALRQVRSPQLAEEVAQSTFADLARNADRLARAGEASSPESLTPWLYTVTRRTAIDVIRREARRQLREQIAMEMNAMKADAADWTHIEPLLDEAMHALDETDRAAVLLRYFENKSLREVGATLGTSDDAAQKRVSRAVEQLRAFFTRRGVTVGTSALVLIISANAVQSAPVELAVTISTTVALAGTSLASVATTAAIKTITMTTMQKTLVAATIAVLVGTGIYQARQTSILRHQVQALQQQLLSSSVSSDDPALSSLKDKLDLLGVQNAELTNALAQANTDKIRIESEREQARHAVALFKELADQASLKDTNPTNEYPTSRHVWAAFGRMGRLSALSKDDDNKLSPEEKSALEATRMKALQDLPNLVKAAKYYDERKPKGTESQSEDQLDNVACLLYGALNLDEQQFGKVYSLMQQYDKEARQKGLSEATSAPEKADAVKQMIEQFKAQMPDILTAEQARIFADVLTHVQLEPGKSSFNFTF